MIDILRTDGYWGDGTLVCRCCQQHEAPQPAAGDPALCDPCNEYLRRTMKRTAGGKVQRMLAAVKRKLTGGDA